MRHGFLRLAALPLAIMLFVGCVSLRAQDSTTSATGTPGRLYQGKDWSQADRADFYSRDQGSRIMPISWFRALRRADGSLMLDDGLRRYGYLDNPDSPDRLPVGFTVNGNGSTRAIGMTCAACHTRELEVEGVRYRIDGGPAIVDFQAFLTDIDLAVGRILSDPAAFASFARAVRATDPRMTDDTLLRKEVALWYLRYHTLMERALPADGWGLGRLDAVSMIFNRLTGLDLGPAPSFLIASNIAPADAPVRYPFIWDAPRQDHTQWPGFAANGDNLLALSRNLGEVYGVFGDFMPHKSDRFLLGYDFVTDNSANFSGLRRLEDLVRRMKAPVWPWAVDANLRSQGQAIFNRSTEDGGCQACHAERRGTVRFLPPSATWKTPLVDVGTDTRQYQILARTASSGAIEGALKPSLGRLKPVDRSIDILATSVIGAILQNDLTLLRGRSIAPKADQLGNVLPPVRKELEQAFNVPPATIATDHKYEARVLHGIWSTAPYLHNGSVPTLRELLTDPAQRVASFDVGAAYDRDSVGLARTQTGLHQLRRTTGCDRLDSGNSRCGHKYGTWLSEAEKRALLEYLKTL